jgi:formylglycine-generating enzyme required for sulfatase activity
MDGKANFFDQGDRPLRPREYRLWNDPYPRHAPVGLFPPNPFGLHNVFGNVVEWCQDGYGSYRDAPTDGSAHELPSEERRVSRGTSFQGKRLYARSAVRPIFGATMLDRSVGVRPAASLH